MRDKCPECGSGKIARDVALLDHIGDFGVRNQPATARVFAKPDALILKESVLGTITLDVCGDCGLADMRVSDAGDLYRAYLEAKKH